MIEQETSIEPEGEIEAIFSITGRGFVLILKEGWRGNVPVVGVVIGNRGSENYFGLDIPRTADGAVKLAVMGLPDTAKEEFEVGDIVKFRLRTPSAAEAEVVRRMKRQSKTTHRDWKSWLGKLFRPRVP
jgi:hypothetical protein